MATRKRIVIDFRKKPHVDILDQLIFVETNKETTLLIEYDPRALQNTKGILF